MGIYIQIKKINKKNEIYYYEVNTTQFDVKCPFYIGIDSLNKMLLIYKDLYFKELICNIDLINPSIPVCSIPAPLIARIITKVKQALKDNAFTEYISYEA
ncbi:MAG TPA: hypothetical protein VFF04_00815 [Candidatus Babeliales bacterium]|nr:hypothetical protein [Candidatus Babeliales bacterium]